MKWAIKSGVILDYINYIIKMIKGLEKIINDEAVIRNLIDYIREIIRIFYVEVLFDEVWTEGNINKKDYYLFFKDIDEDNKEDILNVLEWEFIGINEDYVKNDIIGPLKTILHDYFYWREGNGN